MADHFIQKRRLEIVICLFLVSVSLLIYLQVRGFEFVTYDDESYITKNTFIKAGFTSESIIWAFTSGYAANWHPLTWLSHMLDIELYGLNPMGHHWSNLQIHIVNVVLLFLFLRLMTGAIWKSAFVSALFAIHPMHVESVAWVAERKDVLCAFFWILSMWAYVLYVRQPNKTRYLLLIILFVLGLMSKPMIVTLPFTLLLLDFWPLYRFQSIIQERKSNVFQALLTLVWEKIPLFILSTVSSFITFWVQHHGGAVASMTSLPFESRVANAIVSYTSYIWKMVWPLNLAVLYPLREWHYGQVIISGLLLSILTILAFWARKRFPYFFVGWLWFLGTMIPVIGLVQVGVQRMADRYTYIPFIGLFIVVAWGMADISSKWSRLKNIQRLFAGVMLIFFAIAAWFQAGTWENGITLFFHTVKVTHNNSIAYCGLGQAFDRHGKYNEAVRYYLKALQINPNFADAHYELGVTLEKQGYSTKALKQYSEALRIKPNYAKVHNNIGVILSNQGKSKEASDHYQKAIQIMPNYAIAYYNLGIISAKNGRVMEAITNYQKALQFNFNMTQTLYQLSWILATSEDEKYRNGEEAIKLAERLCKVTNYSQPLALDALAAAYAETGKFDIAVLTAQKGLELSEHQGPKELVLGLRKRLELYKTAQPYRQNLKIKNES
jgi:tetratricopeptide (TPR) repeat protein